MFCLVYLVYLHFVFNQCQYYELTKLRVYPMVGFTSLLWCPWPGSPPMKIHVLPPKQTSHDSRRGKSHLFLERNALSVLKTIYNNNNTSMSHILLERVNTYISLNS